MSKISSDAPSSDGTAALAAMLAVFHPPIPPELEGWEYRDFPLMLEDYWCQLLDAMGEGNFKCLAFSARSFEDGLFKRGQFFISPAGMEGIKRLSASLKSKFEDGAPPKSFITSPSLSKPNETISPGRCDRRRSWGFSLREYSNGGVVSWCDSGG